MDLYPPQAEAIQEGVLNGDNMLLACPTASGKTLVAELAMLKHILEWNGKIIYLVPLKALASEKKEEFDKYEQLGIKTIVSTGDFDTKDQWLKNFDIIICSNEKADSLLRHQVSWMKDISLIVSDEVHLITDPSRGPTLEVALSKLRQINPNAQILALSATIKNANEVSEWLNAKLILSEWRPVILREGIYYNGTIEFKDGQSEEISSAFIQPEKSSKGKTIARKRKKKKTRQTSEDPMISLVRDMLRKNGQMIVFTNTRKSTMSLAAKLGRSVADNLTNEKKEVLESIKEEISVTGADTTLRARLAQCVLGGVAFHHAGMDYRHRRIVETYFKEKLIFAICATPTLAAGINLPARRVVIRDYKRYSFSRARLGNLVEIPVLEYKQMAGRAGRPKFDKIGEAILIAKSEEEKHDLFERYILGEPELITSKLPTISSLRSHLLGIIATGFVNTEGEVFTFLENTFYGHQYTMEEIFGVVSEVISFLVAEQLIEYKNGKMVATKFGKRVSSLYIDPLSGVIIRNALQNDPDKISNLGLLHLISSTPNVLQFYLRKKDYGEMMFFLEEYYDEFLIEIPDEFDPDFEFFLSDVKTAKILLDWIDEKDEEELFMRYNIGSGDLYNLVESADWLLYATLEIAKLLKVRNALKPVNNLLTRVKYGVKEELMELVTIKGIGRKRGRLLYRHGIKTIEDLKSAQLEFLLKIPTFGQAILEKIFEQIERDTEIPEIISDENNKKKQGQTRLTTFK